VVVEVTGEVGAALLALTVIGQSVARRGRQRAYAYGAHAGHGQGVELKLLLHQDLLMGAIVAGSGEYAPRL